MALTKKPSKKSAKKPIEQYEHKGKERVNNPPVGLVTPETDKDTGKKSYAYDPHLDPQLQWAGKAEHTSFEVPTVSLHVHERIDPRTIMYAVKKKNGGPQMSLFESTEENPPLRDAIDFYKHKHNWSNRLIAGDSLLVMNSLIEKEGLAGQVQMVYIDPPYGIKYGSNFQPFVNKRDVKDGKDEDLTAEPETIKAFRDTWELGIHSYLAYLRDRLLLAKELLTESGSCFVQISDENVHLVRNLMDEVFGIGNFVSLITFRKTGGIATATLATICDYIIWYGKEKKNLKYHQFYVEKENLKSGDEAYKYLILKDGSSRTMTFEERSGNQSIPEGTRICQFSVLYSEGAASGKQPFEFHGKSYYPPAGRHWKANYPDGMKKLKEKGRIALVGNTLRYVRYLDDFPVNEITHLWNDTFASSNMVYVVQTATEVIKRCLLMTTDPGDIVFDPTCGSGTTASVAEQWGRRWITCDTSRVATTLAKQRLMTAMFDYYELAHAKEGVGSGFKYKTVTHITLKSIANSEPPGQETLYDKPYVDNSRARVTGPFTVEAVPAFVVKQLDNADSPTSNERREVEYITPPPRPPLTADESIARMGETLRQSDWRDELLKTGIRGKGKQKIEFSRVEVLPGTRWLHADGETKESTPQRVVVSFGPEHAPLEQRQVAMAIEEAQKLVPRPKVIVFAAFQFDPEASKDIDELNWPGVTLLKAQMNADLLTEDLKKKRSSNEGFWLIGQPDVVLRKVRGKTSPSPRPSPARGEGERKVPIEGEGELYQVEVLGFDYYNIKNGAIDSGGTEKIAMWMLDIDYDGRSLFPRQVFFPMAGEKDGWARLAKNLKAEIDEELIEAYRGTVSIPFSAGANKRVAVKIVDDRGIESLKILEIE